MQGRLESQAPEIDGHVLINDFEGTAPRAGDFRWVKVTAASDYDLVGRLEARTFRDPVLSTAGRSAAPSPRLVQIEPATESALA